MLVTTMTLNEYSCVAATSLSSHCCLTTTSGYNNNRVENGGLCRRAVLDADWLNGARTWRCSRVSLPSSRAAGLLPRIMSDDVSCLDWTWMAGSILTNNKRWFPAKRNARIARKQLALNYTLAIWLCCSRCVRRVWLDTTFNGNYRVRDHCDELLQQIT